MILIQIGGDVVDRGPIVCVLQSYAFARIILLVVAVFQLEEWRDMPAGDLPFGTLKRVALVRALAARPRLLLLDEPTAGMSELDAEDTIATLRSLARERGVTLLVIEHNMQVIMALADRLTVLHQGERIAEGTPDEVQKDPLVSAAYLGEA